MKFTYLQEWEHYTLTQNLYTESTHEYVYNAFTDNVNNCFLKEHRDYIEQHCLGMGQRAFWWQWYLLFNDLKFKYHDLHFLEIGVHKGAVLSLWGLLAKVCMSQKQQAFIYGITPCDGAETGIVNSVNDITDLILRFNENANYNITVGYSQEEYIVNKAKQRAQNVGGYDIVYIDGGHTEDIVQSDILNYSPLIKKGGYLVIDDCANTFKQPWGYFQGIESVSRVVDDLLPPITPSKMWKHVGVVMHNRVWRKLI